MTKRKVNILGTSYNLIETTNHPLLKTVDGVCGRYDKTILIESDLLSGSVPVNNDLDAEIRAKNAMIKRHEILHAYLNECGLLRYSNDELLVNCLATLLPKIYETYTEVGCI